MYSGVVCLGKTIIFASLSYLQYTFFHDRDKTEFVTQSLTNLNASYKLLTLPRFFAADSLWLTFLKSLTR